MTKTDNPILITGATGRHGNTGEYWFSTSQRPSRSCRNSECTDWRMTGFSPLGTTTC